MDSLPSHNTCQHSSSKVLTQPSCSRRAGENTSKISLIYHKKRFLMDKSTIRSTKYVFMRREFEHRQCHHCGLKLTESMETHLVATHSCENTIGPLNIELPWVKQEVSIGALEAVNVPLVVKSSFLKSFRVSLDITCHCSCLLSPRDLPAVRKHSAFGDKIKAKFKN